MPARKPDDAPAPRERYHHGDLRRALLDDALALIAEVGAESFTLRELARRTGVNHRAAYRHFASKDELLATIVEHGYDALVAALREGLADVPPSDAHARLYAIGEAYVAFALREPSTYAVMFGRRLNEDGRFPAIERPIAEAVKLLAHEIEQGQAEGVIVEAPSRDLGLALWSTMHGVASLVLSRRIRISARHRKSYVRTLLTPTLRGFLRT